MDSIYDILQRFDAVTEDIGPEQRAVRQLPALFKPPQTSPQLSGPYPGQNATRGYLVGEGEEEIEEDEDKAEDQDEQLDEAATTEDVLSSMKKKLGDYFQDVATAIRTDPDLKDRIPQTIDQIKAVKTIRTDDGKEIKITGNEDDGFRISIRDREIKTPFRNLDEAVMAAEMYCARRRMAEASADYVEEKRS